MVLPHGTRAVALDPAATCTTQLTLKLPPELLQAAKALAAEETRRTGVRVTYGAIIRRALRLEVRRAINS